VSSGRFDQALPGGRENNFRELRIDAKAPSFCIFGLTFGTNYQIVTYGAYSEYLSGIRFLKLL
jgi:hypothetical protein